jgi:hypothetical protein
MGLNLINLNDVRLSIVSTLFTNPLKQVWKATGRTHILIMTTDRASTHLDCPALVLGLMNVVKMRLALTMTTEAEKAVREGARRINQYGHSRRWPQQHRRYNL